MDACKTTPRKVRAWATGLFFGKAVSPLFPTLYQFVKGKLEMREGVLQFGLASFGGNIDRFSDDDPDFCERSRYLHSVPAFKAEKMTALDNERH